MNNNNWYETEEKRQLAEHIISLEKSALDKWFKGDSSGYIELLSEQDFSYFDSVAPGRIDSHKEISDFVRGAVDGKLFADSYEFLSPRVQMGSDMAVLTFQLHAKTTLLHMHYNCIEVYKKEGEDWRVVHSTWSFIQPMTNDFDSVKEIV